MNYTTSQLEMLKDLHLVTKRGFEGIAIRKDERRRIHRRNRREGKNEATFGSEQCERDYLNSDITRYYACNRS